MDSLGGLAERPRAGRVLLAAAVALGVGLATAGVFVRHIDRYDEGILATNSYLVQRGLTPYRDFYCIYGFGEYYAGAGLLGLLGHSLTVVRIVRWAAHAALVTLAFCIAGRASRSRALALGAAVLLTPLLGSNGDLAQAVALAGLLLGCDYFNRPRHRPLLIAAALTGVAAWFRPDTALYAGLGWATVLTLHARDRSARGSAPVRRPRAIFVAVAIATALLGYLPFAIADGPALWRGLVVIPMQSLPARRLPLPEIGESLFTRFGAHLLIFLVGAALLAWRFLHDKCRLDTADWTAAAVTSHGFFNLIYAFGRADELHQIPALVYACTLVPWLVVRLWQARPNWIGRGTAVAAACYACFSVSSRPQIEALARMDGRLWERRNAHAGVFGQADYPPDEPIVSAVRYVREQGVGERYLFVGLARTDRVYVNDVLFYFLAEMLPAVHDHHFDPLVTTSAATQRRMIADLERRKPRLVVLWGGASDEPDARGDLPPGANLIDLYIRANHRPAADFGEYLVCSRESPPRLAPRLPKP